MTGESGWHPDPRGEARVRWWDGEEWTQWTDRTYHSYYSLTTPGQEPEPSQDEGRPPDDQEAEQSVPEAEQPEGERAPSLQAEASSATKERQGSNRAWYQKKRILLPVTALLAFLLGVGVGGAPEVEEPSTDGSDTEVSQQEIADLREERDALSDRLESAQDEMRQLREAQETAEEEPEAQPDVDGEPASGTYEAGQYEISDVQVTEDFVGDFSMRARVRNTGNDVSVVILKATLFSGGSAVATLDGTAQDLAGGQTKTVEFLSTDSFGDWEEVEFQVDGQF